MKVYVTFANPRDRGPINDKQLLYMVKIKK